MDRYVGEGAIRQSNDANTTIRRWLYALLHNTDKIQTSMLSNHDDIYDIIGKFLSRMTQEWKGGVLLVEDIHREFYEYLNKIDKYENFHVYFNKNHKSISEMINAVRSKHNEIESIDKSED